MVQNLFANPKSENEREMERERGREGERERERFGSGIPNIVFKLKSERESSLKNLNQKASKQE